MAKLMRAFISHSSRQKEVAEKIAQIVGYDQCVIDAFDFAPAYKTMDEIVSKIEASVVFVFLISRESLESDWCRQEVIQARGLVQRGLLKLFLPYIIDESLDLDIIRNKYEWLVNKDTYNLKLFRTPIMIARDLELKFRNLEREYSGSLAIEDIFVGRNNKIETFQEDKADKRHAKSLIVSGRTGTGRHHFIKRCADEVGYRHNYYFETIDLPIYAGPAELITMLNPITGLHSGEELQQILRSSEDLLLKEAAAQINEIQKYQGKLIINDNNVIVDYKSDLADWFDKLLRCKDLNPRLSIFVVSPTHLRTSIAVRHPNLIAIELQEYTKADRRKILLAILDKLNFTDFSDDDVNYFVDKLRHTPSQLRNIANIIVRNGVMEGRRNVEKLRYEGESLISTLLEEFRDNETAMTLLTLIAQTGMISYADLQAIYEESYNDELMTVINQLLSHSLLHETGASRSILQIDSAVGDHLVRIKKELNPAIKKKLNAFLNRMVNNFEMLAESPSSYMMKCKQCMENPKFDVQNLLLPSIAVNYLISLYRSGTDYKRVVEFCQTLLDDNLPIPLRDDLKQDILFYECMAMAHLQDRDGFFSLLTQVTDKYQKKFLQGFFWNEAGDYPKAVQEFLVALKLNPSSKQAKRALVSAYLMDGRYLDAYKYAKENYEQSIKTSVNGYHVTAYFKCLVYKPDKTAEEKSLMPRLIQQVRESDLPDRDELVAGMELMLFVRDMKNSRKAKYNRIVELNHQYPDHKFVKDIVNNSYSYLKI